MTAAVAEAPRNTNRKVQTLTELDQDVRFQVRGVPVSPFCCCFCYCCRYSSCQSMRALLGARDHRLRCAQQTDVDLGLLTASLIPAEAVRCLRSLPSTVATARPARCVALLLSWWLG